MFNSVHNGMAIDAAGRSQPPEEFSQNVPDTIALLPCGGQASRISPLPLSKELYPIGFRPSSDGTPRPKVVCHYLLETLRLAGITTTYFILRSGKWDIPAYFGDGTMLDMHLAYLVLGVPYGVPYTLDQAYPFVCRSRIAFGFPDILLQPEDVFVHLLTHQSRTHADVVLGLFPCDRPDKAGMVEIDAAGRVQQIIEKPGKTHLKYMWATAVWTPRFSQFMHDHIWAIVDTVAADPKQELPLGDVIQAAIAAGLRVEADVFETGHYLDIGTPDDLVNAVRYYGGASIAD
jgi:glucose-1-phosphate thymidylyltransferase